MGTRNLTVVRSKGKTKIAQYGQWDGYPTGQGKTIAKFLKDADIAKFTEQVDSLSVYNDADNAEVEKSKDWKKDYPELSRDQGAEILNLVHSGKATKVVLQESFKDDKIFCEYWYLIDLDNGTVSMNEGGPVPFDKWTEEYMEELEKNQDEETTE